jgi:hypothetical protein
MLYYTQNYWIFALCPSPDILKPVKHNVSEADLFPSSSEGGKLTLLPPLERAK